MPLLHPFYALHSPAIEAIFWLEPGRPRPLPLMLGYVEAGFPSPAMDYIEEVLDLNDLLIRNPPATFMMRVAGESMKDAGIYDGDLLVVDRSLEATHNSIVIALLDGELTVKHLYRRRGQTGLVAANDAYPTIVMGEGMDLIIWGVVTHVIRALR